MAILGRRVTTSRKEVTCKRGLRRSVHADNSKAPACYRNCGDIKCDGAWGSSRIEAQLNERERERSTYIYLTCAPSSCAVRHRDASVLERREPSIPTEVLVLVLSTLAEHA